MFYSYAITVPANTTAAAPVRTELKLTAGVIQRIELQFPIGTLELLRCAVKHRERQAWPSNPDGYFSSDGYVIPIDEFYPLDAAPYTLVVEAWNLDDTYAHVLSVRVGVLRPEDLERGSPLMSALRSMLRLIGLKV